jgi:hypothetical protein
MDIKVGDEVTKLGSNFFGRVVQILPEGERTIGVQWSRTPLDERLDANGVLRARRGGPARRGPRRRGTYYQPSYTGDLIAKRRAHGA